MNKDKQRIKIAEACGWKISDKYDYSLYGRISKTFEGKIYERVDAWYKDDPEITCRQESLPDYINNLNNMHEAEKYLFSESLSPFKWDGLRGNIGTRERTAWVVYMHHVHMVCITCGGEHPTYYQDWVKINATTSQRAKSFLKTLNLWEESE